MRPELAKAIELLQRDTPESVNEAIALLQNTVYSFSMKVCGHPEDAEDTTQEVLFRSLAHLAKIQNPQALAVWLYTVTRNRCWRMRRKPANAPARTLSLDELMPDDAELAHLLADAADNPEGDFLQTEQQDQLHQAILRLPAQLRIALVLHDMEELSTDQVAQILDLQPGTVRVRLHRARLAVRKEMHRGSNGNTAPQQVASAGRKSPPPQKRPPECRELFANLSEYIDGTVDPLRCDQMQKHIEGCPSCVAFVRDLRAAIDRCRALAIPCDENVASRLRSLLTREYFRMLGVTMPQKTSADV
jgi:RNA polymerase sigma-70 factor (ECF subfamily)